jgi:hypothetical protein
MGFKHLNSKFSKSEMCFVYAERSLTSAAVESGELDWNLSSYTKQWWPVIQVKKGILPVSLSCYKTAERGSISKSNSSEKRKLSRSF